MAIHESGEDYLETILLLQRKNGYVRKIDVANELGFSRPSVTRAIGILEDSGLVKVENSGLIELTEEGVKKAEDIYTRHKLLVTFYRDILGVDEKTANEDACKTEHAVSAQTVRKLQAFVGDFLKEKGE